MARRHRVQNRITGKEYKPFRKEDALKGRGEGKAGRNPGLSIKAATEMGFPEPKPTASCECAKQITDRSMHLQPSYLAKRGPITEAFLVHRSHHGAKMNKTSGTSKDAAHKLVRGIMRKARKHYCAEGKIRIVLAGLRGEESIAALTGRSEAIYALAIACRRLCRNTGTGGGPIGRVRNRVRGRDCRCCGPGES